MKNSIKNLKNYFQLIVTAVTCFMMGLVKDKEKDCTCERCNADKKAGFLSRVWRTLGMSFVWETPKAKTISEYLVRDKDADKKKELGSERERKKNVRKNKIIYWDEPRIQNRISKSVYFNTG